MVPRAVVLASRSPQRRALLEALGVHFVAVPADIDELTEGDPRELVVANALAKARAVAEAGATVIAGDTEVVLDGRVFGQPADEAEAREFLSSLSGREHEVLGGVAVIDADGEEATGIEASTVAFRVLDPPLIDSYLASGEWEGRAGGYAIQGLGSALVEGVRGDLSNVIGLPIPLLMRLAPQVMAPHGRSKP